MHLRDTWSALQTWGSGSAPSRSIASVSGTATSTSKAQRSKKAFWRTFLTRNPERAACACTARTGQGRPGARAGGAGPAAVAVGVDAVSAGHAAAVDDDQAVGMQDHVVHPGGDAPGLHAR